MPTPEQYAAALTEEPTIAGFARYIMRGKKLPNEGAQPQGAMTQYAGGGMGYHQYAADQMQNGLQPVSMQEYMRGSR